MNVSKVHSAKQIILNILKKLKKYLNFEPGGERIERWRSSRPRCRTRWTKSHCSKKRKRSNYYLTIIKQVLLIVLPQAFSLTNISLKFDYEPELQTMFICFKYCFVFNIEVSYTETLKNLYKFSNRNKIIQLLTY